eukprot:Polyplicarium_translucidae@DN3192_c0_g1_i4.p1
MSLPTGDVFHGSWTKGLRNGLGRLLLSSGCSFSCQWADGKPVGEGTLVQKSGNEFQGVWTNCVLSGEATHRFCDGSVYQGEYHENAKHGKGKITLQNGTTYTGQWYNDMPHGEGVLQLGGSGETFHEPWTSGVKLGPKPYCYQANEESCKIVAGFQTVASTESVQQEASSAVSFVLPDGSSFNGVWDSQKEMFSEGEWLSSDGSTFARGPWVGGRLTGSKAEVHFSEGHAYVGEMEGGQRHGEGCLTLASRIVYQGTWDRDMPHGTGAMTFPTGERIEAVWEHGLVDGPATMKFADGTTWTGEVSKSQFMNGRGKIAYADGSSYTGDLKNGMGHGSGRYQKAGGTFYQGSWEQGRMHGKGAHFDSQSGSKYTGMWKDNRKHGAGTLDFKDGSTYKGPFQDNLAHGTGVYINPEKMEFAGIFNRGVLSGHMEVEVPPSVVKVLAPSGDMSEKRPNVFDCWKPTDPWDTGRYQLKMDVTTSNAVRATSEMKIPFEDSSKTSTTEFVYHYPPVSQHVERPPVYHHPIRSELVPHMPTIEPSPLVTSEPISWHPPPSYASSTVTYSAVDSQRQYSQPQYSAMPIPSRTISSTTWRNPTPPMHPLPAPPQKPVEAPARTDFFAIPYQFTPGAAVLPTAPILLPPVHCTTDTRNSSQRSTSVQRMKTDSPTMSWKTTYGRQEPVYRRASDSKMYESTSATVGHSNAYRSHLETRTGTSHWRTKHHALPSRRLVSSSVPPSSRFYTSSASRATATTLYPSTTYERKVTEITTSVPCQRYTSSTVVTGIPQRSVTEPHAMLESTERKLPIPLEHVTELVLKIPKLRTHYTHVPMPIFAPRLVELPVPVEMLSQAQHAQLKAMKGQLESDCGAKKIFTAAELLDFAEQGRASVPQEVPSGVVLGNLWAPGAG